jgi:CheY-like chemotaxis protein
MRQASPGDARPEVAWDARGMDTFRDRLLLVEDESLIRMDLAMMLEDMGYSVVEAADSRQALAMLDGTGRFDVLVTDIDMPGRMNGLGLACMVSDSLPRCRILILSGGRPPASDEMPAGSRFLSKPATASDLRGALHGLAAA